MPARHSIKGGITPPLPHGINDDKVYPSPDKLNVPYRFFFITD